MHEWVTSGYGDNKFELDQSPTVNLGCCMCSSEKLMREAAGDKLQICRVCDI
jgi:hypothetical protein